MYISVGGLPEENAVTYLGCKSDSMNEGLPAGETWTASSRGACLITWVTATPTLPNLPDGLKCASYHSSGTSYSIFFILMKGDDACCVRSSHETPQECP